MAFMSAHIKAILMFRSPVERQVKKIIQIHWDNGAFVAYCCRPVLGAYTCLRSVPSPAAIVSMR